MSGIVGLFDLDGAPADPRLLRRLTDFQAFRGPDAQRTWIDGQVGFGHALLRTSVEAEREVQPFTLDDEIWIVADARVDAQDELIAKLQAHGRGPVVRSGTTDVELILRAYQVWGEDCVEHLLGDFAFAIWDRSKQRLFCARDQIGIKPLFYAQVGSQVIFSNTLDCIRQHPAVSDKLNDLAVADFLILEMNQDLGTTTFADIQRLPPAHRVTWSSAGMQLSRYWTMPVDEPLFYRRSEDYLERFRELVRQGVGDRLRGNQMGIFLSGGLDSTTLAVTTRDLMRERYGNFQLQAHTKRDFLIPEEGYYAELVAKSLDLRVQYHEWGANSTDTEWERHSFHTPEPHPAPWATVAFQNYWREVEPSSRVFLYGEGPDNALRFEWRPYVSYLLREGRYGRLIREMAATVATKRQLPFWGKFSSWLTQVRSGNGTEPSSFPDWIDADLESRLQLRSRWRDLLQTPAPIHPLRPQAYSSFQISLWQSLFEGQDAGWTRTGVELRHPFLDLRVLRFLFAVPPLPWCRSKYLMRRAMADALPKPVLRRSKSGISCATIMERLSSCCTAPLEAVPELNRYVDLNRVPKTASEDIWIRGSSLRVRALNHWLRKSWRPVKPITEAFNPHMEDLHAGTHGPQPEVFNEEHVQRT